MKLDEFIRAYPHVLNPKEALARMREFDRTKSARLAQKLSRLFGHEPDTKDIHGRFSEYHRTDGPKSYSDFKKKLKDNIPF